MSYQNMDHAGWIEHQIAAAKKRPMRAADRRQMMAGCGWYAAPEKLSPDQARIFDIVGMVAGGVYNAPIAWNSLDWHAGRGISFIWRGSSLSTFDFYQLTTLVFLCHEARIRGDIGPGGPRMLRMSFHPRAAEGGMSSRHPNLEEATAAFRAYLPPDHRIIYRAPALEREAA